MSKPTRISPYAHLWEESESTPQANPPEGTVQVMGRVLANVASSAAEEHDRTVAHVRAVHKFPVPITDATPTKFNAIEGFDGCAMGWL